MSKARRARPSGPTTAAVTAMVAAAVALLTSSPLHLGGERAAGPPDSPAAVATVGVGPAPAPAQSTPPTQSTPRPAEESKPFIAQSQPRLLEVPSIRLRAAIRPYTQAEVTANGGAVKPPTLWDVAWWTGGGTPGTDSDNTVYLYGHTWKEPAVFNNLKNLRRGADVYVTTRTGRLRYVVDGSFTVSKKELANQPAVTAVRPGRLLLLGCYRETGREEHTTQNVVVSAHLA